MNALTHTALPLPDAFQEPGLYALLVRPGDGQAEDAAFAAQMILRTDLAPTVWRGADGLTVQVRAYSDARPRAGVRLDLLAHDNDILAQATTDADGVARFAAPLLAGTGPLAPAAIHGTLGADLVALDLEAAAFDLSDRGVVGPARSRPARRLRLYRSRHLPAGRDRQLTALLRDNAGQPADIPARIRVKRPNGRSSPRACRRAPATRRRASRWRCRRAPPPAPGRSRCWAIPTGRRSGGRSSGWTAFVPDRMAVELGPDHGPIVAGTPYDLPVAARFLYGAPGAGLPARRRCGWR